MAIVSTNLNTGAPGEIDRFHSDLTPNGVFAKGGGFYTGVAVDPLSHDFYGARTKIQFDFSSFGTPGLDRFSSSGTLTESFELDDTIGLPPMAADSTGRLFYPSAAKHAVLVLNTSGVLQEEIKCTGCPGGSFGEPESVAIDSADNLYVADISPDRVLKPTPSGGHYSSATLLQSGRGAAAVGVDPGTGDVLVGDLPNGADYHIIAYDSSGTQFDDFGAGLFRDPPALGAYAAYQMAVNATTHTLYVGEFEKFYVFERGTTKPPTASTESATNVGQLTAKLNVTVNANGHAALDCEFEYTSEADVTFASATSLACPKKPNGSTNTALSVTASGLAPNTPYRYRVTATTNAGSVSSGAKVFKTLPEVPPTVTMESPTAVTETTATLRGKVNPQGGTTSDCHFEFGASTSYGSTFPCSVPPESAATDVAETQNISGLIPSAVYHYRLVISTNAGTSHGEDVQFTTASPPGGSPSPTNPASPPSAPVTSPALIVAKPPLRCKRGFRKKRIRGKVKCVRKSRKHRHRR